MPEGNQTAGFSSYSKDRNKASTHMGLGSAGMSTEKYGGAGIRWLTQKEGKEDGRAEVQGPNWLSLFR
ncbi:Acetylcholine Receptor Subunit Beta [Manis pentadactyla]|nr:Acetylcholine Receptor Subunit Beta [Manis pentadactyla]